MENITITIDIGLLVGIFLGILGTLLWQWAKTPFTP